MFTIIFLINALYDASILGGSVVLAIAAGFGFDCFSYIGGKILEKVVDKVAD